MEDKITIPEDIQQICKDICAIASKKGLRTMSGSFDPPGSWGGKVSFNWEAGRHGEDSNQIQISSQFYIHTTITEPKS